MRAAVLVVVVGSLLTPSSPGWTASLQAGGPALSVASFADPVTLQPLLANDLVSGTVAERLYEPLVAPDPDTGEAIPNLATWTVSADGRTYDLEIRPRAHWSDGRPIVAEDWLTSVKAVARSRLSTRKPALSPIVGFTDYQSGAASSIAGIVADGKRLSVTVSERFCPALLSIFGVPPIPAHVFAAYLSDTDLSLNLDHAAENTAPPATSGPFRFKEWIAGTRLVLERNPRYWRGAAALGELVFEVTPAAAVVARLVDGSLTLATVAPQDVAAVEAEPSLRLTRVDAPRYDYIGWNVRSATAPALADPRIRKALAYGLDMDRVIDLAVRGEGTKVVTHTPFVSWAYPSGLNPYPFDPARAKALIQEAGYTRQLDGYYAKDGVTLGFSLVTNAGNSARAAFQATAVEQYASIGVRVTPRLIPFLELVAKLTNGDPSIEAWMVGWLLGPEPDPYQIWHSSQIPDPVAHRTGFNFGGFTAPGLDAAIEAGRNGDCSIAARRAQYDTVNRILNDEQPYKFGFSQKTFFASRQRLRGFAPGPFNAWRNVHRWVLAGAP